MGLQNAYSFGKRIDASFGEIEQKVRTELAKEGFGVLTGINSSVPKFEG